MNQRVGPSLVLSFLIVGFFAIALYQRDPVRSVRGRPRTGAGEVISRSGPAPPASPGRGLLGRVESTGHLDRSSTRSTVSAGLSDGPSVNRGVGVTALLRDGNKDALSQGARESRAERALDSSDTPLKQVSARASRPYTGPKSAAASASKGRTDVAREPRSAFTVAKAGETIEDVALRVYGTIDQSDAVWRANRDSLPRRDSPLSPGMLLRTPKAR